MDAIKGKFSTMIAFGFLILLIGIWVLINTFNGNLPGLVNIPGVHDATTGIRGLTQPPQAAPQVQQFGVATATHEALPGIVGGIQGSLKDVVNAVKGMKYPVQ